MFLRYYLDENGNRVYTLKMRTEEGVYTHNAHPGKHSCPKNQTKSLIARFSPDDKYSKERLQLKARFGLLPMQQKSQKL